MKKTASQQYKPHLLSQTSLNAAIITGILGFIIHPFVVFGYRLPNMGFLVWIYLVPLLIGIHRHKFTHKLILCFLAGLITSFGNFYWLITAMQKFGGLNFFQSFGALTLMCIFLSLLFAFFTALASWSTHIIKVPFLFLLPIFLTTRDLLLHHFPFNGFPWNIPAYALNEWISYFQWVDCTGVLGLSFFIYLINGLIAGGFLLLIHRKQIDKMVARFIVIVVLMVVSLYLSFLSNQHYEKNKTTVKHINIALIQGNIAQNKKWDPYFAQEILNTYFSLSHKAIKDGANLIIWPETAYPFNLKYPDLFSEQFLNKERLPTPMLIGAFVTEPTQTKLNWYNSVVQINADASMPAFYKKRHLVPFGEFLPFKKYLKFIPTISRAVGELTPGNEYNLFETNGLKVGSLICFEDIFPKHAREFAKKGADFLVNYTNDAWYGNSSAQHQHLVFSQFRALENRRYLFRATNNGITAIITPRGEIFDRIEQFHDSYLVHNIKIDKGNAFFTTHKTIWVDVVAVLCLLIFLYAVIKKITGPVKIKF